MFCCLSVFLVVVTIVIGWVYKKYRDLSKSAPRPDVDVNKFWGPESKAQDAPDTELRVYKIAYPDAVRLRQPDYIFR